VKLWRCKLCGWLNPEDGKRCLSCEKRRPRARKEAKPRESEAIPCVLLALDTANRTGWALGAFGSIVSSGEHPLYSDAGMRATNEVLTLACALSSQHKIPIVIAYEVPWGGRMAAGETKAEGYWIHAARSCGVPMRRFVKVYPSQWRAVVLPPGSASLEREEVRKVEAIEAAKIVSDRKLGSDECAAVLIFEWAKKAGEVLSTL
jgi:hypothetical protein